MLLPVEPVTPVSAIKLLPVGTSHGVKKLLRRSVPDLSKFEDISEFITK